MNGFGGGGGFLTNNNNSAGRGGYGGGYNGGNSNYGGNNNFGGGYGGRGGNNYDDSASKMNTTPSKGGWNPNNNKKGSIIPLTIKKLIEISGGMDDVIEVDKYSVDQAVLVARVYKFEEQSTRVILHMDDTTGRIQVAYYKKNDAQATSSLDKLEYKENMYVKAVIVVRPFKNQKLYVSNMLQEVTDYNQVTYHFLSTFLASAYRLKGALPNRPEPDNANKNPSTQNNVQSNGGMGMNFGMGGGFGNKDPRTMVKEMIMHIQHQTNNGICKQSQLFTSLRGKVDPSTIQECLMRLENDGEICHNDANNGEVEYVMLGS